MKERPRQAEIVQSNPNIPHQHGKRSLLDEVAHRLAFEVSLPMQTHSLWGEDVMQAALLGAVSKLGEVDEGRSWSEQVKYLVKRGRGEALDELRRLRRERGISRGNDAMLGRYHEVFSRLGQDLGRTPTRSEVATEMGVSMDHLEQALLSGRHLSLEEPVLGTNSDRCMVGDTIRSTDAGVEDVMVHDASMQQLTELAFGYFAHIDPEDIDPVHAEGLCYARCLEAATEHNELIGDDEDALMTQVRSMFEAVHAYFGFVEPIGVGQKEAFVLRAKYIHNMPGTEIATMLGVTPARVSQMLKQVNQRLAKRIQEEDVL